MRLRPQPSDYTFYYARERSFVVDISKENTPGLSMQSPLAEETIYTIKGNTFIVEPIFKENSKNTVGSILMRLMQSDNEKA